MMKIYVNTVLLLITFSLQGGNKQYPPFISDPNDFLEKVEMLTDRDIYFINEELFFQAQLESAYEDWSQVIYIQLISYNGEVFHQSKYRLGSDGKMEGMISIPPDMFTGYYYLRAYTKWMRNYSQYNYFYKPILIINSLDKQVLAVEDNYSSDVELDTLDVNYSLIDTLYSPYSLYPNEKYISALDFDYKSGSICMVREELIAPFSLALKRKSDYLFEYHYPPEINGLSITGKVVNDSLKTNLAHTSIFFSVLGDTPYSSVMKTDQWGKFYFNIKDDYGHKEVMLSLASQDVDNVDFLIDHDFCVRELKLPYISPMTLDRKQWEQLQESNANAQVETAIINRDVEIKKSQLDKPLLYSKPTLAFNVEDYIEMPTLKDYIYEVIPMIGVRHDGDFPELFIRNSSKRLKDKDYKVLIIYDGVYVRDVSSLINISPKKIERIEVFNHIFVLGNEVFGGVFRLESKSKDISNLELTEDGVFVNFQMLYENAYKERLPQKLSNRELLYNNTVLWSASGKKAEKYLVPDREGEYLLMMSKWDNGRLLRRAVRLRVN